MHARPPQRVRSIVQGIVSAIVFILLTAWILLTANGYAVNIRSGSVRQTTAITLAGAPENAKITLDHIAVGTKLPLTLRDIDAGRHTVRVSADGYADWLASVDLGPGEAVHFDQIVLFLEDPTLVIESRDTEHATPVFIDPTLEALQGELYQLDQGTRRLITRFSQPILAASAAPDQQHLVVQLGSSIYITERDGSNTTKVLDVPTTSPVLLSVNADLTELTIAFDARRQVWRIH